MPNNFSALLHIRFLRFLAVGVLNTIFGYACYALLVFSGLAPWLALLLATCLGMVFNFFTIGRLVFKSGNRSLFWHFAGVYVFVYLLNNTLLRLTQQQLGPYLAQGLLVLPMAMVSYLLMRQFVFKGTTPDA